MSIQISNATPLYTPGIVVTASSPFGGGAALGAGRELKIMAHEKKVTP